MTNKIKETDSHSDWIELIAFKYRNQKIVFRQTASANYINALLMTPRSNMIVGVFDINKEIGRVFDRRKQDRE
jgi:hypothetical protein